MLPGVTREEHQCLKAGPLVAAREHDLGLGFR